jgi:hypothetical protein
VEIVIRETPTKTAAQYIVYQNAAFVATRPSPCYAAAAGPPAR